MLTAMRSRIHNPIASHPIIQWEGPARSKQIRRKRWTSRGDRGFALVDLLAALAIAALIASIAVPSYQRFMADLELDLICQSLVRSIRTAQQLALNDGVTWNVIYITGTQPGFGLSTTEYRIERDWTPLPQSVRYASGYTPDGTVMRFYPTGGVGVTGSVPRWTIGFTNRLGRTRYVIVSVATGRPRVSDTPPS